MQKVPHPKTDAQPVEPTPVAPMAMAVRPNAGAGTQSPKFGGNGGLLPFSPWEIFTPNSVRQLGLDVFGVWGSKLPLTRSKTQFFEDAFLEWVENAAFYFTIPAAGRVLALGANKFFREKGADWRELGKSYTEAGLPNIAKDVTGKGAKLIGTRAGTVLGTLAIAGGFEYMIQHAKNVITAKKFDTRNFAAVAGLEDGRPVAVDGEMDPVEKAKKRAIQVGATVGGVLAFSAALPFLAKRFNPVQKASKGFLQLFHFNSSSANKVAGKPMAFDLEKPLLAALAGIGAVSYIDAARDNLERKETATRLLVVIPYMIFGKELAENALAKGLGKLVKVSVNGSRQSLEKHGIRLLKEGKGNILKDPWKQMVQPDTFLKHGVVKSEAELKELMTNKGLAPEVIEKVLKVRNWGVDKASFVLSALLTGAGINAIAYAQTKKRHDAQQANADKTHLEAINALNTLQPPSLQSQQHVNQAYSGFAAQGRPLAPSNPRLQSVPRQQPFQPLPPVANQYTFGQWRI